jgi:hypothetical protein
VKFCFGVHRYHAVRFTVLDDENGFLTLKCARCGGEEIAYVSSSSYRTFRVIDLTSEDQRLRVQMYGT